MSTSSRYQATKAKQIARVQQLHDAGAMTKVQLDQAMTCISGSIPHLIRTNASGKVTKVVNIFQEMKSKKSKKSKKP